MTGGAGATNPDLDAAQRAHLKVCTHAVQTLVASRGGWLGFDEYLQQVLYAPGLGYYSAGAAKFGAVGDFVTAPEISRLFGACVARACAPLLRGGGDVLEFGAGSGALAETLLAHCAALDALPEHYFILEVSADLRERQRARLAGLPDEQRQRVQWLERLPHRPLRGVVLANEVADALPFECFEVLDDGYAERGVALDGDGRLQWSPRPAAGALLRELERLGAGLAQTWPPGYRSELCRRLDPWLAGLATVLEAGAMLLFDYGLGRSELYHPQRDQGTLRCHFRHRAHENPLLLPGLQDISAWVDFTRAAEAGSAAGLEVAGYCTQAAFLIDTGIEAELAAAGDVRTHAQLASEARTLLMSGEMGETFKVLALTRGAGVVPGGFGVQDLRRLL